MGNERWAGLYVQGDEGAHQALKHNLPRSNLVKLREHPTHDSSDRQLRSAGLKPEALDVLKIQIDSYDCPLLEDIVTAGWQPKVVIIRINPAFPPPLQFFVP